MKPRWEHFEHKADVGIRGYGATPAEAFAQCACALTAVITDPALVAPRMSVALACAAPELDALLLNFLDALLLEMDLKKMLFSRFEVQLVGDKLTATAWGEAIEPARHQPAVEVKAATYHALAVRQLADDFWLAQCVVDV
ncbi:MAG: archease [Kiritimatiellaeota bacterium]|nr:archease [Kiritimatiellota bacterium]